MAVLYAIVKLNVGLVFLLFDLVEFSCLLLKLILEYFESCIKQCSILMSERL